MLNKIIITICITLFLAACTTTTTTEVEQKPARQTSKANLKEASNLNTQLAIGYIQRQQYKAAKEKLEKAIEQNSNNVIAYKTLAYLYALLGLKDEAEQKYEEALDQSPNDSDLLNSYGAFLCSIGKLDEAQEKLKQAYSDPFYESVYLAQSNAGSCYIKEQAYAKAEKLLRKSLRTQPNLPGSLLSMAEIGIKTERYMMARAYIQRYHTVKQASAESLWIQIQAEKALGAKEHYMKYARQLISEFPDSDEAGWVEAQARNEQFRQ
jgi:type IV pilus assembly protein PilF